MKFYKIIFLLLFILFIGFYSCSNDDETVSNISVSAKTISADEIAELIAGMPDSRVYNIDSEEDFNELCIKVADLKDQELLGKGYKKVGTNDMLLQTRASVQPYTKMIHPYSTTPISNSQFKAKFSKAFCDEINIVSTSNTISPSKTYLCAWRDAGTFFNLASNQRGGPLPSLEGALIPSTKSNYKERGYEAYVSASNQYIIVSHQLSIICEDVSGSTTLLDIRYPFWNTQAGYIYNFSILTL